MNSKKYNIKIKRKRMRIKSNLFGTSVKPRLLFNKTNKYLYASIIDDEKKKTLLSLTTLNKENIASKNSFKNIEEAKKFGALVAKEAVKKSISTVVFDRNIFLYHGKIKAFADSARENGLKF